MTTSAVEYSEELKAQLKKLKQSYPNLSELEHFYKQFKKLCQIIKEIPESKDKTPAFFQALHQTTIDMRMKLLADLGKSQNLRKKAEEEHEELIRQLKAEMDKKQNLIAQLKRNQRSQPEELEKLRIEIRNMEKQGQKMKSNIKGLTQKLNKQLQMQKAYRNQIKKLREDEATKAKQNRRLSPSPDRVIDNTENRTLYDNVLGSFSDLPNDKNFTEWDHTYSQPETDRKAKSVYVPNNNIKMADELWRFILVQAVSVEEFINQA